MLGKVSARMREAAAARAEPWLWQMERVAGEAGAAPVLPPTVFDGRMGAVLRQALLLDAPAASLPGLSLSVTYAPAFAEQGPVGGDFFDAFALPGQGRRVALLVGDMEGKGLEAAVHIAAVKFALRALLRADSAVMPCPGSALSRLNKFVCQAHALDAWEPGALVSVALVILDTATGEGRFALAASEAPIVLQHGDPVEPDDAPVTPYGMPLGAMAWEAYEAAPIHLPDGAALLLLTDGLTEARRPERTPEGRVQFLGYEGVARLAMAAHADAGPSPSLPEVGRTLVEHTRAWAGDRLRDDVCLLLARRASI